MRLRTRVFITLLSVSVVLVLTMAGLFQFGFERGLDRFLNERRQSLLSEIAADLSGYYSERGDFDGIGLRLLIWAEEDGRNQPPDNLVLLDAERMPLFGPQLPEDELVLYPIEVFTEVVGWVGVPSASRHRDRLARNFRDSQIETLIRIILPALLLALIGTWLLSRQLLRPIEQSAALARRLSDGEYQARLPEQRDDELGDLIRSMNRLAHSLAASSTARERWLADISHELRTPVAVLQGELEALVDGIRAPDPQRLASLHQEVLHLRHLLDDLHDLALADAGALRYRFVRLDLKALLQDALQAMGGRLADHALQLSLQADSQPVMMQGDATRLRQLIDNLLDNSIKYTDRGGQIQVSLQSTAEGIQLTLADSAPGVAEQNHDKLFERLFRVESSRNRELGGAGLGLALCRRIAEAHGGNITAAASPLGGLQITVNLRKSP
ncbi:ATP-binding protein [Alcanivorax sp. 1008]|uniref:ATP-binding protein n=1 Tax=Alcanivorax sp. 1008 TaxID=2816853 RepID=UPI001D3DBC2C|nr:ATP-binding protein [Alcanivorax sp. 1008]MCC1495311.1 HAMP domain-containing protein [Alcanivorax sp. 1008]